MANQELRVGLRLRWKDPMCGGPVDVTIVARREGCWRFRRDDNGHEDGADDVFFAQRCVPLPAPAPEKPATLTCSNYGCLGCWRCAPVCPGGCGWVTGQCHCKATPPPPAPPPPRCSPACTPAYPCWAEYGAVLVCPAWREPGHKRSGSTAVAWANAQATTEELRKHPVDPPTREPRIGALSCGAGATACGGLSTRRGR